LQNSEGVPFVVTKIAADPRIDPRIKAMFGALTLPESPDVPDRETLVARANSEEAKARTAMIEDFLDQMDNEAVASSNGLTSRWESLVSVPDGNTIRIHFIRPDNSEIVPCVYYIHGAGWPTCRPSGAFSRLGVESSRPRASQ
jgi:acetyl esterase